MITVWIAVVDQRSHRIPNAIVIPATTGVWGVSIFEAVLQESPTVAIRTIAAGLLVFFVWYLLAVLSRGNLGGGDVKFAGFLASALALLFGWSAAWVGALFMVLAGGISAVALVVFRRRTTQERLALGPSMAVGSGLAAALAAFNVF